MPPQTPSLHLSASAEALAHIDSVWAVHRPDVPINRTFYEQTYEHLVYEDSNSISMGG